MAIKYFDIDTNRILRPMPNLIVNEDWLMPARDQTNTVRVIDTREFGKRYIEITDQIDENALDLIYG